MMSQLLAITASVHRDRKRRPKQYDPEDFMPGLKIEPDEEAKQAALKAKINDAMAELNARNQASERRGRRTAESRPKIKK